MDKIFKTEAIILKKINLLEKDLLIIFFTKKLGKISVFSKGVKKITSKRLPHLQTGNLLTILLTKNKNRFYLKETNLISGFSEIKKNQKKINFLYQYFFVLEKILPENQQEKEVYQIVKLFLSTLGKKNYQNNILEIYLNKTLKKLGYLKEDKKMKDIEKIVFDLINEKIPSFII